MHLSTALKVRVPVAIAVLPGPGRLREDMRCDDDWNHYSYTYGEGKAARVEFDVRCALFTPQTHPVCIRVRATDPAAVEAVVSELDDGVWLVGRLHFAQACTLVFQCECGDALERALPAGSTVERSDGWGYFDERVCPQERDWRRIADREQVEQLVAGGLDPEEERSFEHRFYGGSAAVQSLLERLRDEGLEVSTCSGERASVLRTHTAANVSETSVALDRFARSLGVAYDGWSVR